MPERLFYNRRTCSAGRIRHIGAETEMNCQTTSKGGSLWKGEEIDMLKILKYLAESKWSVLAIVVLLVLQAYCDLALPQYTADIVDVGIGQKGIESAVPERMRESTYEALRKLMSREEQEQLASSYKQGEDGSYIFCGETEAKASLEESMGISIMIVSMLESGTVSVDISIST